MVVPLVSWHDGSVPEEIVIAVGVPTSGVTVIVPVKVSIQGPVVITS